MACVAAPLFVIPGEDPGSSVDYCLLQRRAVHSGSRLKAGMTKKDSNFTVPNQYDDLVSFPDEPRRDTSKQDKDIAEARYRAVVNAKKAKK